MLIPFTRKKKAEVHQIFNVHALGTISIPLYSSKVSAGLPTMSEDFIEGHIDLNHHLIRNPSKSFIVRVSGDSMIEAGIHPDDLLLVDQSIEPENGKVVIAVINGELTVKRLWFQGDQVYLMPENPGYSGIEVTPDMNFQIWGVVTSVIHRIE